MPVLSRPFTPQPAEQLEGASTYGEALGASIDETLATGPTGGAINALRIWGSENLGFDESPFPQFGPMGGSPLSGIAVSKSPMVTPDNAKQQVKDAGLEGEVPLDRYPDGIRRSTLDLLISLNKDKVRRQTLASQYDGWSPQVAGMLIGSVIDPANVALAFVPVVGEARYAKLLKDAGSAAGRFGVRSGVGAAEGLVGSALAEPLIYAGQQQWRNDYDAYDSFLNVAGGAVFGSLLHAGVGLVRDSFGNPMPLLDTKPMEVAPENVDLRPMPEVRAVSPIDIPEPRAIPDEFVATTKGGQWRLRDTEAPAGTDFSEFGQVRQVEAFDGDTVVGKLVYANDGTPPTIEVDPNYQRKGIATAMLKLAKERGGVLGDARTGIRGQAGQYRTEAGQAFRSGADEESVSLRQRTDDSKPQPIEGAAETAGATQARAEDAARQWAERGTESPYFRNWFGASKVKDASGQPLIVYHGTSQNFDEFRMTGRSWFGEEPTESGAFFTTSRSNARSYGENTVDAYLSIKKPYEVTDEQWSNSSDILTPAQAKEAGYDGYVIRDQDGGDTYIAFSPEQIKSASANSGLFNPSSPSISDRYVDQLARALDPSPSERAFVANLDHDTQAAALRQAVAQAIDGRPIDVTPAMLSDPQFRGSPTAYSEALNRAKLNTTQVDGANLRASNEAEVRVSESEGEALATAKALLDEDKQKLQSRGVEPEPVEDDLKASKDAVKAMTMCLMRANG